MVNFGDALRKALSFSVDPKRWLPLMVLDASVLLIILTFLLGNMNELISTFTALEGSPYLIAPLLSMFLGFVLLGSVWYILRFWIIGSLVHQSYRPQEDRKAYALSLSRLHKLIVAVALISIISGLIGMIPVVGWILSIIISLLFFFVFQGIILDDLGVINSIKNSKNIFMKSKFDVFIIWLLISLISVGIFSLFALPLIVMFFGIMMNIMLVTGGSQTSGLPILLMQIQNNLAQVITFGFIALVGMEISQVFAIKAQTEFYLQLRKKFPSIIKGFVKKVGRFF